MPTKIEWCDETINPVVGCSKCSPGCDNCYAEGIAARLAKNPNSKIRKHYGPVINERGQWSGRTSFNPDVFIKLRGGGDKSVFLCSMGDLFHESVSEEDIDMVFGCICLSPEFRFLVLTKRPTRMAGALPVGAPPNVWLGVTVCNQAEAEEKIPTLMSIPAAGHFISAEPLLGPLDLMGEMPKPDWIIVGGETGPKARPMHPDWVRTLRDQCQVAGVPFFFKGWGEWAPDCLCGSPVVCKTIDRPQPGLIGSMFRCGRKESGRRLNGVEHNEKPW